MKPQIPHRPMTHRVSSNFTLFFKLFIPTVWIVFFTSFTLSLFIISEQSLPFLTAPVFKYPFLLAFLFFLGLIYFTIMQLKRVEMAGDFYIVSNYFKTLKLYYQDIQYIKIISIGRLQIMTFKLKGKGSFGDKIVFLASKQLWNIFCNSHPEVKSTLDQLIK
ncbi:MAG: hypothetical protein IPO37_24985 [Saprospiraceae bacterium]|jgi:hypothetical protein|nr:hypothetical protein [Saprospiraceae bacterium]